MEESCLPHTPTPQEAPSQGGTVPAVVLPRARARRGGPTLLAPARLSPFSLLGGCDFIKQQELVSARAACDQMHRCSKLRKVLRRLLGHEGGLGGERRSFWK